MQLSLFLAQVIGIYLVVSNLSVLIHLNRSKKVLQDCLASSPLVALTGAISLMIGLLIVVSHDVWVSEWPVVITLIGWITVLHGAMRLFFPQVFVKVCKELISNQGFLLLSWLWLLIGFYLMWAGFNQ